MHTFAQKPKATQQTTSAKSTIPGRGHFGQSPEVRSILHLQRTIGNQAVQRMLQTDAEQPEAELTGPASPRFGHDFSRIPIHPPAAGAIQTKLAINKLGDSYEQEADRMAEQVMRTPEPQLQRACPCGGGCPKCHTEQPGREHESLQTKHVQASDTGQIEAPPTVHEVLRSPGQPLDPATRAFMEPRFGHDFSPVRVHSGARPSNRRGMWMRMLTPWGTTSCSGRGGSRPRRIQGRRLLAHELSHVVQQVAGAPSMQRKPAEGKRTENNVEAARRRGRRIAKRIRVHTRVSKEVRATINSELASLDGAAKEAYLDEVRPALLAVTPIEMPAMQARRELPPVRKPSLDSLVDSRSLCGGGDCEQIQTLIDAPLKEMEGRDKAEQTQRKDAQLQALRAKTDLWKKDEDFMRDTLKQPAPSAWREDQAFAIELLDNVLQRNLAPDPRGVSDAIRTPVLQRYEAWLKSTDAKAFDAKKGAHARGPGELHDLQSQLRIFRGADHSAVDTVYTAVLAYRKKTDPYWLWSHGYASAIVNAGVAVAGGAGQHANRKSPPTEGPAKQVKTSSPSGPPAQTIKASPPPPPQQTSRPGAPTPVTDVEVVKTNVDSPASIKIQPSSAHQTDWTVRGGSGKAPAAYRDSEGTLHVSTDHPLMGDPNRGGIPPVRPGGPTSPVRTPSRTQLAPSSTPTGSGSGIGLEDTGKAPATAKPAVDPGAKTAPAAPKDAPVPKDAPTGGAGAQSKREQAPPPRQIDPPQAVSRQVVENIRNRPRTVDPRRRGRGSNVHYSTDHQMHELAWQRSGGHGDSPPAFIYDKQVYLDPSRWKH